MMLSLPRVGATLLLGLLAVGTPPATQAAAVCEFFARAQGTRNDDGQWTKVEPLNVNEFFVTGQPAHRCTPSLGEFGAESIFQFSEAPGAPLATIFFADFHLHILAEATLVYGSLEALEQAVKDAGGVLDQSISGTNAEGGLPTGMTVEAQFFFLPDGTLFAAPLSVVFENSIAPGEPIGSVVGIGSREVFCGRECGVENFDNRGAVAVFYHFFNVDGSGELRTTMSIEEPRPGVELLTAEAVVPCACTDWCIP